MTLDITQFYQTFFDEADELLAQMEQLLLNLDVDSPDPEDLAAIFRAAHSIKGGAATFGFSALTDTTHILESLLDRARNHELTLTKDMIDAFLETKDVLSDQLADYRASAEPDAAAAATMCAKLERLKAESGAGAPVAVAAPAPAAPVAAAVEPVVEPAAAPAAGGDRAPDHVVEQAVAAAHPADDAGAGGPHLKITLVGVDAKDQALLTEELGNLGRIVGREEAGADLSLWVESDVPSDDIVAVCCFVIDESQIRVAHGTAPAAPAAPVAAQDTAAGAAEPPAAAQPARVEVFAPQAAAPQPAAPAPAEPAAAAQPQQHAQPQPAEHAAPAAAHHDDKRARPAAAAASGAEGSSIRVGVEKVDQLINLVGELVITQAMLAETASAFDPALHDRLFNGMAQLERNARDLQEAVMSIRMMPMDYVFSRFPRLVRDLAGKLGKQVELVTFGQATELDKSLIERIIDPLTHLVRNSLDHGIETVDKRVAAGKDAVGQLVLSAAHHGGNIVIEVSDDGAGLNRERILAKAAKQGMQVSDNISDDEVWQLIFAPGFSTAETVTDVSGRGDGMDVGKRNIQSMGGHVEITSLAGRGTTTRIVLPLTL
ncbi:MAG: Hpt domain-containing protein, partial [Burkholderia sp.]|nr:Hpt domain-containing protein [Burkholderia sp.]